MGVQPPEALRKVSAKPELLLSTQHSLCPGCGEPLALRAILELLTELDVNSPLRGFSTGRFRDTSSVLFNVEYRYPIWDNIDGTVFFDNGKVFNGIKDFSFSDWRYSVGGGIRFFYGDTVFMRLQAGYGGEGVVVIFRLGEVL